VREKEEVKGEKVFICLLDHCISMSMLWLKNKVPDSLMPFWLPNAHKIAILPLLTTQQRTCR